MPKINLLTPHTWESIVTTSNARAMSKHHQYPLFEYQFFSNCLTFVPTNCSHSCFCRKIHNNGVWVTKENLMFSTFLEHFINLWARGSRKIVHAVNTKTLVAGRYKNAVATLIAISNNWNNWDNTGKTLPSLINTHRKTILCDASFSSERRIIGEIVNVCGSDTTGVYTSKIISQLFPDLAIPFDTASRNRMISDGYNPLLYGDGLIKDDTQKFILAHKLTMHDFRKLDKAPISCWHPPVTSKNNFTACSRVIDKLFY